MEVQPPPLAIARKFSKTLGLLLHIKSVIESLVGGGRGSLKYLKISLANKF